jgi:hypothetical protein
MLENITYNKHNVMIYELKLFWNKRIFYEPLLKQGIKILINIPFNCQIIHI